MKKLLPVLVAVAAVAAWPAGASARTASGVVVGKMRGAVLVASPSGIVHAFAGKAAVGSRVVVSGGRVEVVGRARFARIRGIMVRRMGSTMFLSANRHLVAVHTGRRLASANDSSPTPTGTTTTPTGTTTTPTTGDQVSTQVTFGSNGQLDEDQQEDLGPSNASNVQIQATVTAVGNGTITLSVNGQTLTVPLPAGLTLPSSLQGQTVTLDLSLGGQNGEDDQVESESTSNTSSSSSDNGNNNSGNNSGNNSNDGGDGGGDH